MFGFVGKWAEGWVLDRLKERSTWLGLIGMATSAGLAISPHWSGVIVSVGVGAASLVAAITKDPKMTLAQKVDAVADDVVTPAIEALETKANATVS